MNHKIKFEPNKIKTNYINTLQDSRENIRFEIKKEKMASTNFARGESKKESKQSIHYMYNLTSLNYKLLKNITSTLWLGTSKETSN